MLLVRQQILVKGWKTRCKSTQVHLKGCMSERDAFSKPPLKAVDVRLLDNGSPHGLMDVAPLIVRGVLP